MQAPGIFSGLQYRTGASNTLRDWGLRCHNDASKASYAIHLEQRKDPTSQEIGSPSELKTWHRRVLVVGSRCQDIHDSIEILDTGKLDAYLALPHPQGDLDIGIEAVG